MNFAPLNQNVDKMVTQWYLSNFLGTTKIGYDGGRTVLVSRFKNFLHITMESRVFQSGADDYSRCRKQNNLLQGTNFMLTPTKETIKVYKSLAKVSPEKMNMVDAILAQMIETYYLLFYHEPAPGKESLVARAPST